MVAYAWKPYRNIFNRFTRSRLPVSKAFILCDTLCSKSECSRSHSFLLTTLTRRCRRNIGLMAFPKSSDVPNHTAAPKFAHGGEGGVFFWNPARIWAKKGLKIIRVPKTTMFITNPYTRNTTILTVCSHKYYLTMPSIVTLSVDEWWFHESHDDSFGFLVKWKLSGDSGKMWKISTFLTEPTDPCLCYIDTCTTTVLWSPQCNKISSKSSKCNKFSSACKL